MNNILLQDELLEIAEVKQQAKLILWLNKKGIRYGFTAKKRVFSTIDQINDALRNDKNEAIEFE